MYYYVLCCTCDPKNQINGPSFARRRHKRPSGSVLDIIIRLKNMNKGPIRRIRLLPPWDGTPLTGWKEIQSLPPGVVKDVNLKIDCGTRGKAVRCELKTVSGSYMITIEPPKVCLYIYELSHP